jgi:large subunit ribosomal protein L9
MATKPQPQKTRPIKRRQQVRKGPHGGMQLLLVNDVPNLGKAGEVVEVRAGYGRNYLLPRGLATGVSEHNLRLLERHNQRLGQLREAKLADLRALAVQIQRVTVTIEANANEEGHLYGSVGAPEISAALRGMNLIVEPEAIRMEGPIKEVALYGVKVHLAPEVETEVKVLVINSAAVK